MSKTTESSNYYDNNKSRMSSIDKGFKASDIANHLKSLKENSDKENWWDKYITFDWKNIRDSKNTRWMHIRYSPDLVTPHRKLTAIIRNEVHTGYIIPNTIEELNELKNKNPENGNLPNDPRKMKPSIQIQKWSVPVRTQPDSVIPLLDDSGNPMYPSDDFLSDYFQVAAYVDEIFSYEFDIRHERGLKFINLLKENKNISPSEIREKIGHKYIGDTIIDEDKYKNIRDKYSDEKCKEYTEGFVKVKLYHLSHIIQDRISDKAIKNKGLRLPNPITRISLVLENGKMPDTVIQDKTKKHPENKKSFELARVDGELVNAENVHKFITPQSRIDGFINLDSVCFSQLGISIPVKATLIVVDQYKKKNFSPEEITDQIYDTDDDENDTVNKTPSPTPDTSTPSPTPDTSTPSPTPTPTTPTTNLNIDDLAKELDVK
jgi:hypothetical protein